MSSELSPIAASLVHQGLSLVRNFARPLNQGEYPNQELPKVFPEKIGGSVVSDEASEINVDDYSIDELWARLRMMNENVNASNMADSDLGYSKDQWWSWAVGLSLEILSSLNKGLNPRELTEVHMWAWSVFLVDMVELDQATRFDEYQNTFTRLVQLSGLDANLENQIQNWLIHDLMSLASHPIFAEQEARLYIIKAEGAASNVASQLALLFSTLSRSF